MSNILESATLILVQRVHVTRAKEPYECRQDTVILKRFGCNRIRDIKEVWVNQNRSPATLSTTPSSSSHFDSALQCRVLARFSSSCKSHPLQVHRQSSHGISAWSLLSRDGEPGLAPAQSVYYFFSPCPFCFHLINSMALCRFFEKRSNRSENHRGHAEHQRKSTAQGWQEGRETGDLRRQRRFCLWRCCVRVSTRASRRVRVPGDYPSTERFKETSSFPNAGIFLTPNVSSVV
jgi:hypothetical protein